MNKYNTYIRLIGGVFMTLLPFASQAEESVKLPNIVVIYLDDMGYGDPMNIKSIVL